MQNIFSLLQKIYDVNNNANKSVIEIDIMMDYTRLLYEELNFEKQRLIAQKTPPNFYNIWNSPPPPPKEPEPPVAAPVVAAAPAPAAPLNLPAETAADNNATPPPATFAVAAPHEPAAVPAPEVTEPAPLQLPEPAAPEVVAPVTVEEELPVLEAAAPEPEIAEDYLQDSSYADPYPDEAHTEPEVVYADGIEEVQEEEDNEIFAGDDDEEEDDLADEEALLPGAEEAEPIATADNWVEEDSHNTVTATSYNEEPKPQSAENSWEIEAELKDLEDEIEAEEEDEPVAAEPVYHYPQPVQATSGFYQPVVNRTHEDIRRLIGINDKYQIISEIFHNNKDAYEAALNELNRKKDYKEAAAWMHSNHPQQEHDNYTFQLLDTIMHRFYND